MNISIITGIMEQQKSDSRSIFHRTDFTCHNLVGGQLDDAVVTDINLIIQREMNIVLQQKRNPAKSGAKSQLNCFKISLNSSVSLIASNSFSASHTSRTL